MCGVMTVGAVMGAGQALMGHIGKVQEADAANEALSQDYAHKVRTLEATHRDAVIAFQARDVDAQINWASNTLEFNRFIKIIIYLNLEYNDFIEIIICLYLEFNKFIKIIIYLNL